MDWFRMYGEFASDPKMQSMSEAMQRRFVMLLCLRCSNALVTLHVTDIAFAMRISEEELEETKSLFIRKSFINDNWEILNWEKRQYVSDSSAARVARHRANKKLISNVDVTNTATPCNVTVTPQNRTDTEQIQKKEEAQKKTRNPTKTFIPNDFKVSERVEAWAKEKGFANLDRHLENFISACKAKGYQYIDWDEAFMSAIRNNWAKVEAKSTSASQAALVDIRWRGAK